MLQSYKMTVPKTETIGVKLNKMRITAIMFPANFNYRDINIFGADFPFTYKAHLSADFEQKNFNIKFGM
ncbi:uncharacterized protein OCT59_004603 [Rhizophagus irregularis]|uniref:uncharacterized protein n=1 Tax=Rhizophagus irregularis TaxID=588596 RepID=UPI0033211945|nr:hypothetical protein OCT59_004603 [Rhizophagus irregularis]